MEGERERVQTLLAKVREQQRIQGCADAYVEITATGTVPPDVATAYLWPGGPLARILEWGDGYYRAACRADELLASLEKDGVA